MTSATLTPKVQAQFLPEADLTGLEQFRIDGKVGVRAVLREMVDKKALLTAFARSGPTSCFVTRIVSFEGDHLVFDATTDDDRLKAVIDRDGATLVGFLDHIKVQFDVSGLRSVPEDEGRALQCPLPASLYRIQRRDAFRVRPPLEEPALCVLPTPDRTEVRYVIVDISVGGLALRVSDEVPRPKIGERWQRCRLELGKRAPIPCALVVRNIQVGHEGDEGAYRLGCSFESMPPEVGRAVQLFVLDVERRRRER